MKSIQEFYSRNPFPGPYTWAQLMSYDYPPDNRYLKIIDRYLHDHQTVLDVGCGTGLISNLFATRYLSKFVGVDFSDGVDYAQTFAKNNRIDNVEFIKQDFFNYKSDELFDTIICQSFITHVPDYVDAISKMTTMLKPGGTLIIGVYNNYGKILKKLINIDYKNSRLAQDQEQNPFEISFSHDKMISLFQGYTLQQIMPSIGNRCVPLLALMNSVNGGLTVYVFKK